MRRRCNRHSRKYRLCVRSVPIAERMAARASMGRNNDAVREHHECTLSREESILFCIEGRALPAYRGDDRLCG